MMVDTSTNKVISPANRHVLVIEDDLAIQEALRDILETEGYVVTSAVDGADALLKLAELGDQLPGLILLDLMMPRMDGFQFRVAQMSEIRIKSIPVVAMSADSRALERLASTQPVACLKKPIDADELLKSIEQYIV